MSFIFVCDAAYENHNARAHTPVALFNLCPDIHLKTRSSALPFYGVIQNFIRFFTVFHLAHSIQPGCHAQSFPFVHDAATYVLKAFFWFADGLSGRSKTDGKKEKNFANSSVPAHAQMENFVHDTQDFSPAKPGMKKNFAAIGGINSLHEFAVALEAFLHASQQFVRVAARYFCFAFIMQSIIYLITKSIIFNAQRYWTQAQILMRAFSATQKEPTLMKNRNYYQSGFTLIELMIVIAIIGILAAIAVPNFLRARDMAKYSSCLESLSSVRVGEEMYMTDHSAYTGNSDYLVMYMAATCTDPAGAGPGCVSPDGKNLVDARITNDNCGPTWAIDTFGGMFTIRGTSRDKNTCHICVGASGYRPDVYRDCPIFKAGFHADCPNL